MVPPLPEADDLRGDYDSVEKEMIARASHALPAYYSVDNAALAKILKEMVSEFKDAITWARDLFRNQNGRQVMLDWMLHFSGTARQETVEITAEATMNMTFYKGEKPRFTFIVYANIHRGYHNEINFVRRLAQPPLAEMDELLKVRKYLKGIEAPEMAAAAAAVKASPTIRLNFDQTADFLTGFVSQNSPSVRVASVTHGGRGRGGGASGGKDNRRDRDSGEAEEEAEVEKPEEAVAVVEVAVAEEDVATRPKEEEAWAHSRGLSQTGIILLMNILPSHLKTCNNVLKYVLQETPLEA